jgi:extracellular factor (EF) 3-hydroxypalmitic acid methyl ester biosynthesis protein
MVDNDPAAISRARANTLVHAGRDCGSKIEFVCRNALRFRSEDKFDLVWSSGLFDYLNNKTFVFLARRLKELLSSSGLLVLGNFASQNPSRPYMELVGEWFLVHRTRQELLRLAEAAGFQKKRCKVVCDETGLNLFLMARH